MCEIGLGRRTDQYIGVFEQRMERVYARIGLEARYALGARSDRFTTGTIAVGLWDVSEDALAEMRGRKRHPRKA